MKVEIKNLQIKFFPLGDIIIRSLGLQGCFGFRTRLVSDLTNLGLRVPTTFPTMSVSDVLWGERSFPCLENRKGGVVLGHCPCESFCFPTIQEIWGMKWKWIILYKRWIWSSNIVVYTFIYNLSPLICFN